MDSIQSKLGYNFTYHEHLKSAFVAAHRSERDGIANDGNRGMARIGQIAIDITETSYAVVVEKARLSKHYSERICEHIIMRSYSRYQSSRILVERQEESSNSMQNFGYRAPYRPECSTDWAGAFRGSTKFRTECCHRCCLA